MALYPSTLFHFTSRRNLFNILKSTFKVSYARERIAGGQITREFAVPMVSFSDLRLSELKHNIGTYGRYGIGLTKSWAIANGLNPVMYASMNSLFTESFLRSTEVIFSLLQDANDSTGKYEAAYNNMINTLRYVKNYNG